MSVIIKNGKMVRDGKAFVPSIGDSSAIKALESSKKARDLKLNITKGQTKFFRQSTNVVTIVLTCPYCHKHHSGHGESKSAVEALSAAEGKLYPANCDCGAVYVKRSGTAATQENL